MNVTQTLHSSLFRVTEPVAEIFPEYFLLAVDINEALDPEMGGMASCGPRAYAAGLLIEHAFPNPDLYAVNFGIDPEHGNEHRGKSDDSTAKIGHAVAKFWVRGEESTPLIIDSTRAGSIEIDDPVHSHQFYRWYDLREGYRRYLDEIGYDDITLDHDNLLEYLLQRVEDVEAIKEIEASVEH